MESNFISNYNLETEFKVLMYCGNYIDASLLGNGIYHSQKPFIYSVDETIESLIMRVMSIQETTGYKFSDSYFENLKQCELVRVSIKQLGKEDDSINGY